MSIRTALENRLARLQNNDKGFTLIELLVVVIIIGILAAIAIPVFLGQQDAARDSQAQSNLATAKVAYVSYLVSNSSGIAGTTPTPAELAALEPFGWPAGAIRIGAGGASFCFEADGGGTNIWRITPDVNAPELGECP